MGVFNWVDGISVKCPKCGREITDFQTKDGDDLYLNHVDFRTVSRFYTSCRECRVRIEYKLKRKTEVTLEDYELTVEYY